MSRDSRCWSDIDIAPVTTHSSLEQLQEPLLLSVASEMSDLRANTSAVPGGTFTANLKPVQIPFPEFRLGPAFAAGGGGTIHSCEYNSDTYAAKRTVCLNMTREEIAEVCAEMFFLAALHSEFVVGFIGFVV